MRVVRSYRVEAGASGFDYRTIAVPDSDYANTLQEVRRKLSPYGASEPAATVFNYYQDSGITAVGLWVPSDQQVQAEQALISAGFQPITDA